MYNFIELLSTNTTVAAIFLAVCSLPLLAILFFSNEEETQETQDGTIISESEVSIASYHEMTLLNGITGEELFSGTRTECERMQNWYANNEQLPTCITHMGSPI